MGIATFIIMRIDQIPSSRVFIPDALTSLRLFIFIFVLLDFNHSNPSRSRTCTIDQLGNMHGQ